MRTRKMESGTATYHDSQEVKNAVFEKIISWLIKYEISSGMSIMQGDDAYMSAPELLAEIVDDILEFDIKSENEI